MILWIPLVLGGLGLLSILSKKTFLGVLTGAYLLILSGTTAIVLAGAKNTAFEQGHVFALMVLGSGLLQWVTGLTLASRLYNLEKTTDMKKISLLRH